MSIKYNVIIQKEEKWYVAKCIDNIFIIPMHSEIAKGT